jgi:manganese/zinc/iron transport system permease protein
MDSQPFYSAAIEGLFGSFPTDADSLWVMLIGSLVGASCALVGCFLILRRLSMLGDAISHAVLPGIVFAFLLTGSRNIFPMLIGAGALGLLTAFLTDALHRYGKLQSDASIGVTFTWLFALGVILISRFAGQVDLDTDCVLYGEIIFAPLDTLIIGDNEYGPRAVWMLGGVTLANLLFVMLGYKQLKVCAFDPELAASLGVKVALWHYLLMGFVSMTTVGAFESVGAILVVAMLVVPPNIAYLLTDRLGVMIGLAVLFGVLSAVFGYWIAYVLDASVAGAMATVSGFMFILAALGSPSHGVIARQRAQRRAARSMAEVADTATP